MRLWTTLFLPISLLLLCGCKSALPDGLVPQEKHQGFLEVPYFTDESKDYIYRANITAYGHDMAGIAVIKRIEPGLHRVVLTTEFGNKLIDLEIAPDTHKVNAVVDELNRKMLIKVLVSDFRLMLNPMFVVSQRYTFEQRDVFATHPGKETQYLYLSQGGALDRIVNTTKRKTRQDIRYTRENDTFASVITIEHQDMPLRISLQVLNNP